MGFFPPAHQLERRTALLECGGWLSPIQCYLCGGTPEFRRVTAENWWGEQLVLVENVPAWVCRNCGEQHFDAVTCRSLDALRAAPPGGVP